MVWLIDMESASKIDRTAEARISLIEVGLIVSKTRAQCAANFSTSVAKIHVEGVDFSHGTHTD